jgi:hypothetical protein
MSGRGSVIDNIVRKSSSVTPPEHEEEVRAAIENERQSRTRPAMLVVSLKNGDELLLAYSLFRRAFKREGGRVWELVFDDCSVIITGRNLSDKLRDMLRLQRLSMLREGNLIEEELVPEDKAFIESIKIREKDEEEQ